MFNRTRTYMFVNATKKSMLLVWWNSQDFSCEKLLFHPQSRVQNHICVWSLCPRVSTKKWHQDAAKGSCKKTLIISKGLVNFTLNINLPFEKMSLIWTRHQFHWRASISMLCSALMVLWSKKCLYHVRAVGAHGLPVCICSICFNRSPHTRQACSILLQ